MHPLSRAHNDWSALVADARRWPAMSPVADGVPDDELRLLLKAPVTVAWWITTFAPEFLEREHLDLLMIGVPGGPSAGDDGRPYQLLPLLLERRRLTVDATIMLRQTESNSARRSSCFYAGTFRSNGPIGGELPAATIFVGSLAQLLEDREGKAFDLCLLMHPGFDERAQLWAELLALFRAGTLVGCFARGNGRRSSATLGCCKRTVMRCRRSRKRIPGRGITRSCAVMVLGLRSAGASSRTRCRRPGLPSTCRACAEPTTRSSFSSMSSRSGIRCSSSAARSRPKAMADPTLKCSSACRTITPSRCAPARCGRWSPTGACASKGMSSCRPK